MLTTSTADFQVDSCRNVERFKIAYLFILKQADKSFTLKGKSMKKTFLPALVLTTLFSLNLYAQEDVVSENRKGPARVERQAQPALKVERQHRRICQETTDDGASMDCTPSNK